MRYRKDIQILRGIAVLFVVLFHLEVPGFGSGFLGVDIFFVISGYLMAMMYDPEEKAEFFRKRAARLLPAYFATIFFTLAGAAIITKPNDFREVVHQASFGIVFASNIGFWMENSYFDKSLFKPFLHLWSLGVEIQFYLLVPLFAALFKRYRTSYLLIVLSSAISCFVVVGISPNTAFFMLPFRLWEFLTGFGVATYLAGSAQTRSAGKTAACSAAFIVILLLPLVKLHGAALGPLAGHPGLAALIVSLATGTVLTLGMPAWAQDNPVANTLERIGEYSYSIYLAHFPVIVLFLYQPFAGTLLRAPDVATASFLLATIFACSALLFMFVEQPFRHRAWAIRFSAAAAAVTVATMPLAIWAQSQMLPRKEMLIYEAWLDREGFRCGDFYSLIHRGDISCNLTPDLPPSSRRLFLVGNSHADAIKGTFVSVARARHVAVFFVVQNDPLMNGGRVGVDDVVREAIAKRVDAVVLHYSPGAVNARTIERLVELLAPHGIAVSYLLPIPVWKQSVPKMLVGNIVNGTPLPVVSAVAYSQRNRDFEVAIGSIVEPSFRVYRSDHVFCKPVCKMLGENGKPYYFDDAHLTVTGSEQLRPVIEEMVDDLAK